MQLNDLYPDINGNSYTKSGTYIEINQYYLTTEMSITSIQYLYSKLTFGKMILDTIIIIPLRSHGIVPHKKNTYLTCYYKMK